MHKINFNIDENVNNVLDITINNQDFDNYRLLDISFISETPSFPLYLIRIPFPTITKSSGYSSSHFVPSKALSPIVVTESGMVTEVRLVHL